MRVLPSLAMGTCREASEDVDVNGMKIAAGTQVRPASWPRAALRPGTQGGGHALAVAVKLSGRCAVQVCMCWLL